MMPKRLPHKKSRAGCSNCKRKHVKCDERGPPCANCRVRNLECDFDRASELDTTPAESLEDDYNGPADVGSKRLELELLHLWTSETYRSIVFKDGDDFIWQTTVPQAAFQYEHLLYSIFAMSSLHRSTIGSSSLSEHYRLAALQYQNLAITAFRAEARHITPESSPTLFAFSALNLILAIAFPSCQTQETQSSMFNGLNTVLELLRGTVSIFTTSRTWLSSSPFGDYVRRPLGLQRESLDADAKSAILRLRAHRDEEYAIWSGSAEGRAGAVYLFESMTDAIENLEHCFSLSGDQGQIVPFSWLASLQLGFIEAMSRHEPLALLVIMHWSILLDTLSRERWWARLSGKKLVAEMATTLLSCRPGWLPAISWAHSQVGLPPPAITS